MKPTLVACLGLLVSVGCQSSRSPTEREAASWKALLASIPNRDELILDTRRASELAALSLACIDREYPNKPGNILEGDQTVRPPRELTPAFFGCFDWHSAVHGHWALVRLLKTFPKLPESDTIRARLDAHLNREILAKELAYFRLKRNRTFERPYGWGWLLRLAAELHDFEDQNARSWAEAVRPLAQHLAQQSVDYLNRLSVPIRSGTHPNTAFALVHMLDYARKTTDLKLIGALEQRAKDFFLHDRDCPTHYEPSGEDFISPCLVEADLMRRVLSPDMFLSWLDRFLPSLTDPKFKPLLEPVEVKDLRDPKIGHLIGLALQRAWSFRGTAQALPKGDPRRSVLLRLARLHRHAALQQMFHAGYGGEHWLASFAIYLLTNVGG